MKICPCRGQCEARVCGAVIQGINTDRARLTWLSDNNLTLRETKTGYRVFDIDFTKAYPEKLNWQAAVDAAMEEAL